ncbi:hypothetical protein [Algoriphagus sp.]|uniref:hypothetical protein n=1 Tax=Algoriphagus sp. TaxID=1872435 RepID=UPI0025CF7D66|nr:hypothetical protein [Algoriphagus sp.]
MPKPETEKSSLEKLLKKHIFLKGISSDRVVFQTLINCKGEASDYQLLACNLETAFICKEVLEVFQENIEWTPGVQRGKPVDVLMKVEVNVEEGRFKVKYF